MGATIGIIIRIVDYEMYEIFQVLTWLNKRKLIGYSKTLCMHVQLVHVERLYLIRASESSSKYTLFW